MEGEKIKIAIYVEGQTERIFVHTILDKVIKPLSNDNLFWEIVVKPSIANENPEEYGNINGIYHFVVFDVGSDYQVLESLKKTPAPGFTKVIGLKDLYNKDFFSKKDWQLGKHKEIIEEQSKGLNELSTLFFAIMETEAWFLGLYHIMGKNNLDTDPEANLFHPYAKFKKIWTGYKKRKDQVESICGQFQKEHFESLYAHHYCPSFNSFFDAIKP